MLPTLSWFHMRGRLSFSALRRILLILIWSFRESMQLVLLLFSQRDAQAMDKGFNCHGNLFSFTSGSSEGAGVWLTAFM